MVSLGGGQGALGEDISTDEIVDGAVSYAKLNADVHAWEFIETLTYSADTTKTTSAMPAYKYYMIKWSLLGAGGAGFLMQINSDGGNNYDALYMANGVNTVSTGITYNYICSVTATGQATGVSYFGGITGAVAGGRLMAHYSLCGANVANNMGLAGGWVGGNATQITTFTPYSTTNMTGTVEVWGRN